MRIVLPVVILGFVLLSCNKNKPSTQSGALCLDTSFIKFNIIGPQCIFFLNETDGFIGTSRGDIYKTTDAAKTWTLQPSNMDLPIYGLFFTDSQTGFAVGGASTCSGTGCVPPGGFILKTSDGGQNWTKVYTPSKRFGISSVYFVNKTVGFCAAGNLILKTVNGGDTWTEYEVQNANGLVIKITFVNEQKGFAIGTFNKVLVTVDQGTTWQVLSPGNSRQYVAISALDKTIYLAAPDKIIKSADGGDTWKELPNSPADIRSIHFSNSSTGYAFGGGNYSGGDWGYMYGAIYCTNDGGNTWNGTKEVKQSAAITDVSFPSNSIAYGLGGWSIIGLKVK